MEFASRESGQTLVMLLGAVCVLIFGLGVLGALGKALLGRGRHQRAADLAAVSAARSMRDDFLRLFSRQSTNTDSRTRVTSKRVNTSRALATQRWRSQA